MITPHSRREFLTSSASGLGAIALSSFLADEGLMAAERGIDPLAPKRSHLPAKAKNCIFVYPAGGPSQFELFDPKPMLNQRSGEQLPESVTKELCFAALLQDPDPDVRGATVAALAQLQHSDRDCTLEALRAITANDPNEHLRVAARELVATDE